MSSRPADESTSDNDFSKAPPNGTVVDSIEQTKANEEIREEYFDKLRMWLTTVHGCQLYYSQLQHDLLLEQYQQQESKPTNDEEEKEKEKEEEKEKVTAVNDVEASDQFVGEFDFSYNIIP